MHLPVKGTTVGSYRILDTVSVGGMGTVYRAEHTLIGRLAAVKILHPELCANRDIVHRFFNEARTTSAIKHPGIVEVFDFGYMASGHAYLVMEFLEGTTLSQRVRARGPIPEGEAAVVLRGVCIALSAAHDKGVIHRDLKPDNVFVLPDPDSVLGERTKILDFGIAKLTDLGPAGSATKTGAVMGTPTYMSPEQCRGTGEVDFRADLYSIGCMFYELVTGRPPFVRDGAGELIGSHLFVDPEPPSRHAAGLSPETDALIMALLAKQPAQRVQSAKELAQRLALIAQQHGYLSLGDISRPSLGGIAIPTPAGLAPAAFTPAMTPTTPMVTPASALPTTVVPTPPPAPDVTQKPTTLSGAASQVGMAPPRSRRALGLAVAGGLVAAAGGIAAIVAFGSASPPATGPAAAPPAAVQPAAPAPPAAAPQVTEPPARPAADPTPAEPAAAAAQETPPPAPPPPAPAPATPAAAPPDPAAAPSNPAAAPPEKAAHAPVAKPPVKPAAKPARKPARRPDKAGSASEPKDLLEQDI